MSMDDLTDAMAEAIWSRTHDLTPWSSISDISLGGDYRADARYALTAVQAYLAEHGLLLGPDGLVRAREVGGDPTHPKALFTLIPEEGT